MDEGFVLMSNNNVEYIRCSPHVMFTIDQRGSMEKIGDERMPEHDLMILPIPTTTGTGIAEGRTPSEGVSFRSTGTTGITGISSNVKTWRNKLP